MKVKLHIDSRRKSKIPVNDKRDTVNGPFFSSAKGAIGLMEEYYM